MSLAVTLQNLASLVRFTPPIAPSPAGGTSGASNVNRANLLQAQRQLFEVFESIVDLDIAINGSSALELGLALPVARSDPSLALDLTSFAARLNSTEEINATPTSFTPFGPDWTGASTSLLTVTGAYDGSNGSGDLTFEVRRPGVRGQDRLRIRVYDPQGNPIRTFNVQANHPLDREYSLFNGLAVTVGAGALVRFDTASVQVFDALGSAVDPVKAFNGVRNDNPNLEFGLPAIVDGNFQLNGESIAVNDSDSVDSVIARINQSAAGVTATFNPVTERIEFVQDTVGEAPTIALSGDTSNFLQATKLESAVVTPGKDPDNQRPLADLPIFAGAQSGSFTVNGQAIALDVQNDSLDDVIARINGANAGAVASFDPGSGQVTLTAGEGTSELDLDSNGTGLFPALNLPEGSVDPEARARGLGRRRIRRIVAAVAEVADGLNALFSNRGLLNGKDPSVIALRNQIETVVTGIVGGGAGRLESGVGLRFNRDRLALARGEFIDLDRRKLARLLEKRGSRVRSFFNDGDQQSGFTTTVAGVVERSIRGLASTLGSRGTLIDTFA